MVNQSSWLDKISNPYTALHQLHKKAFDPWRSQFNVHGVYFLETCFLTKPSKGIMLKNQHIWFSKWSFLPSPLLPITRRFHRRQIIDMSQCVTRFGEHSLLSVISAPCLKRIEIQKPPPRTSQFWVSIYYACITISGTESCPYSTHRSEVCCVIAILVTLGGLWKIIML